jgi:hypothetical protein
VSVRFSGNLLGWDWALLNQCIQSVSLNRVGQFVSQRGGADVQRKELSLSRMQKTVFVLGRGTSVFRAKGFYKLAQAMRQL